MDLNAAPPRELQRLPGVGPVTARLIVECRPFSAVEELLRVKGIGPVKFAAITGQNLLYVGEKPSTELKYVNSHVKQSKIDVNAASNRQLQKLKGVGPTLAQRIVDARPFHRKEDLLAVKGIGAKSYVKMQADARVRTSCRVSDPSEDQESGDESEGDDTSNSRRSWSRNENFYICREVEKDVRENVFPMWRQGGRGDQALLVASWNIRNISRRKETVLLERIAVILDEFDLVALQEIRDLLVLKRLKTMLPGWDYVVSDPVGRKLPRSKKRAEYFAFFFRRSVVRPVDKCSLARDTNNVFTRPPCVATFRFVQDSTFHPLELALMNVHVSFGEKESRHAEIVEINNLAQELSRGIPCRRKVVVLGDFNLSPQDVLGSLGSHRMALIRSPMSTTVFNKLYDNIWLDRSDFNNCTGTSSDREYDYLVDSGVLRIDWRFYPPSKSSRPSMQNPRDAMLPRLQTYMSRVQCGYELSDHCPVWVAFAPSKLHKQESSNGGVETS